MVGTRPTLTGKVFAALCRWAPWLLLPLAMFGYARAQHGNVAIMSGRSVVYESFPSGPRTSISHVNPQLELGCNACDPGAPIEYHLEENGVYVRLTDSRVIVVTSNGTVTSVRSISRGCTPRFLQMVQATTLAVTCHEACFQIAQLFADGLTLHPLQCSTGDSGIIVQDSDHHPFHITIAGDTLLRNDPFGGTPPADITPETNCTELLSLHPLPTREEFILRCTTDADSRLYIVGLHQDISDHSPPSVSVNGTPVSSPDGETLSVASGTVLLVYRTNNLAAWIYPGVKDFSQAISLFTYLENNTLLVFLERNQVLVHVETFINSVGLQGVIDVSCSARAGVHKLIYSNIYATSNQTGVLYNVLLYGTENGQLLKSISNLREEPANVVFQPTAAPTLSPTPSPTPSEQAPTATSVTSTHEQVPTSSPVITSRPSLLVSTSLDKTQQTMVPTPSSLSDPEGDMSTFLFAIVVVVAAILLIAGVICCVLLCFALKSKSKLKEFFPWDRRCGPVKQEIALEEGSTRLVMSSEPVVPSKGSLPLPIQETN